VFHDVIIWSTRAIGSLCLLKGSSRPCEVKKARGRASRSEDGGPSKDGHRCLPLGKLVTKSGVKRGVCRLDAKPGLQGADEIFGGAETMIRPKCGGCGGPALSEDVQSGIEGALHGST
jgi:hypothetical protein